MPVERDYIRKQLLAKGFRESSGDHHFYTLWVDGKKTHISTKLSHGSKYKTYDDSLLGLVCRQLSIPKKDFLALIECKLSGEMYIEILNRNNMI